LKRPDATQALNNFSLVTPTQSKHPIQTVGSSTFFEKVGLFETSRVTIELSRGTKIPLGTKFPLKKGFFKTEKISNDGNSFITNSISMQDISLIEINNFDASGINDSLKIQAQYDIRNLDGQNNVKQIKVNKRRHGFFNSIFRFRKEKL
jgi:uncharacterized membrane protein